MPEGLKWCGRVALAFLTLACALDCPTAASQTPSALPDLSTLSSAQRQMIESACHQDRRKSDSAAYNRCLRDQLDALQASPGSPDLSTISSAEQQMIESACRLDGQMIGPAAYYRCLREQVDALQASGGSPDLNTVSSAERQTIESTCHLRQMSGPAAYYRCLRQQVEALFKERATSPSESQTVSGATASPSQGSSSQSSTSSPRDPGVSPRAGRASGSPAVPHSGAASVSTNGNKPVEPSPRPEASSSFRAFTAWFVGLSIAGLLAKIFYSRVKTIKCGRCGNPTKTRDDCCDACFAAMEESARRASEQQAAEQRAREEAERYAREQWEIEESRRVNALAELHQLTGPQFDDMIASLFRKDGYMVRHCRENGDEGIDLILQMGEEKDAVQCKKSESDIGAPIVREFYGALMHAAARHGFIITTASFSQSARDFAQGKPISLISAAEILRWVDGTYSSSSREQEAIRPNANANANGSSRTFDPYAVLGVSPDAGPEEIRAAYRREIVNYHPDKVAHLGRELQEFAKAKAQEINRAYEELAHSQ
jgi:DnaJ-domain-containing protein 1